MNVTIEITKDVRIVGSGVDWSVESRHVSERTGRERWEFEGSYVSPTRALLSLIDGRNTGLLVQSPGAPECLTLAEFVERIEKASRVVAVVAKRAAVSASASPSR